jgi:hypothetical protein
MITREAHVLSPGNALPGGSVVPLLTISVVGVGLGLLVGVPSGERPAVGVLRWDCTVNALLFTVGVVFVDMISGVDPLAAFDTLSKVRFPVSGCFCKKKLANRKMLPPTRIRSKGMGHLDTSLCLFCFILLFVASSTCKGTIQVCRLRRRRER